MTDDICPYCRNREDSTQHDLVCDSSLIDMRLISKLTGYAYDTVRNYRSDGVLPEPFTVIGNKPLWEKGVIVQWLADRSELILKDVPEDGSSQ